MSINKGRSTYVEKFLRYITEEDKSNIDYFFLESKDRNYQKIRSNDDIGNMLVHTEMSYENSEPLLNYSGFNYRHINAVLRGIWNYDENGNISRIDEYREIASHIQKIIMNNPTTLLDNIVVYRGVDLNYFNQYGIDSLDDLKSLEGKYMIDRGFVSTSLQEENCFFKKENDLGIKYNVKIEYMIPYEFKDGIYLDKSNSYSPNQQEYLINSSNLSRVSSVVINDDDTATLRLILIPKELYDDYYKTSDIDTERKRNK